MSSWGWPARGQGEKIYPRKFLRKNPYKTFYKNFQRPAAAKKIVQKLSNRLGFQVRPQETLKNHLKTNTFCVLTIWVENLTVAQRFWGLKVVVCRKVVQKPFEFIVFLTGFPPLRKRFKTQCIFSKKNNPQKA